MVLLFERVFGEMYSGLQVSYFIFFKGLYLGACDVLRALSLVFYRVCLSGFFRAFIFLALVHIKLFDAFDFVVLGYKLGRVVGYHVL